MTAAVDRGSLDWLVCVCRAWLGGAPPAAPPPSWERLAYASYLHQLDPVLFHLLARGVVDGTGVPSRVLERWERTLFTNYIFNTELLRLTADLLGGCRELAAPVAVFKGPVTAARGYGSLELRIMTDVDLLCRDRDLEAIASIARRLGFAPAEQTADYHLGFLHREQSVGLELHDRLYDVIGERESLLEGLWGALETVEIDGVSIPAPPRETAVLLDLAHLAQHDFRVHLRTLLDLAATTHPQRAGALDWGRVAALARRSGLEGALNRLLALFRDRFGWPTASPGAPSAEPDGSFAAAVEQRLLDVGRLGRRPLLSGPHVKRGLVASAGYLARRLFPGAARLRALYGGSGRLAPLRHLPRHIVVTLRRASERLRSGGLRDPDRGSLKRRIYERKD